MPNCTPFVTVIIPTFNRRRYLLEAIDSVLSQTYRRLELLVVDDGSGDGTKEICRSRPDLRYFDTTAEVIKRSTENQTGPLLGAEFSGVAGVSAARNTGIRNARGEFIAFLDSDDLWKPEKIEKQIAYFLDHPDMLVAQTEEIWIRNGRRVNPRSIHKKYGGDIFTHCLPLCVVSPSAVMMRKQFFDAVGRFDETFPVCEDYELWLRAACKFPIGLLDEPLTIKRGGHQDQLSRRHSLDYYRIRALAKLIQNQLLNESQRKAALGELEKKCKIYGQGCLRHGKTAEAQNILTIPEKIISDLSDDSYTIR